MKKFVGSTILISLLALSGLLACGAKPSNSNSAGLSDSNSEWVLSYEDYDQDYESWPISAINGLFNQYGYEGFEIPVLDVEGAIYTITEDPTNASHLSGKESAYIQIRTVSSSTPDSYMTTLSNAGWAVNGYAASKETNNGLANISIELKSNNVLKITYGLRKNGEILKKWPEKTIYNRLKVLESVDVIPEYKGTQRGYDIDTNVLAPSYVSIKVYCDEGREEKTAKAYTDILDAAKWTLYDTNSHVNGSTYISPNTKAAIQVTYGGFSSKEVVRINIGKNTINDGTNPGGNTSQGGQTSQGGNTSQGGQTSQGGDTSQGGETSQGGNTSQGGGESSQEHSAPHLDPATNPDWPTAQLNVCYYKYSLTDQLPVYAVRGQYDVSELESDPTTYFDIECTFDETVYDQYHHTYQEVLLSAGFTERNSTYVSPNRQFQVVLYYRLVGSEVILLISVFKV